MRIHVVVVPALLAALSCAALAANDAASSPESLYLLSAHAAPAEDGTLLTMTVRETARAPDLSVVEVEYVSGGSASSLFLLRGLCGLMQARAQTLAVAEQVSERPVRFRVTFSGAEMVESTKGLPRIVLSESDCTRVRQGHR